MRLFYRFVLILLFISTISTLLGVCVAQLNLSALYYIYVLIIILILSLFSAGSITSHLEEIKEVIQRALEGEVRYLQTEAEFGEAINTLLKELAEVRTSLMRSESRLRSFEEETDGYFFDLDQNFRITYLSPNLKKKYGNVLGKDIREVLKDFPVEKLEHGKFEFEFVDSEGKLIPIEVSVKKVGDAYRCFARNISRRRKIERELAFFKEILEHSIDAIVILDAEGKIIVWSKGAEKLFGYKAEEVTGKTLDFLLPEEYRNKSREDLRKAVKEGHLVDIESPRIRRDGEIILVEQTLTCIHDSNRVVGFVAIMRDVTSRKRAEMELKSTCGELERRTREILEFQKELMKLASIVENSNDAIYSIDLSGRITSWNRTAERLLGWKKEEAIGKSASELLPDEISSETEFIMRRIREGESGLRFETRRLRKNGSIVEVEVTVSPIIDELGQISGISFILRDISEKRVMEREAEKRMLKYDVERGRVYFAESFDLAVDVINDLRRCGYSAKVISRRYPETLGIGEDSYLMFSSRRDATTIEPDPEKIYKEVVSLPGWKNAVLLDLDYLLVRRNFEEIYELIQKLKDVFYVLNKGVLVICSESGLIGERELKLLKMECSTIKSKEIEIPEEIYEVLKFIYSKNRIGERPSIKDVMEHFGITRNTAKKRVQQLLDRGLIKIIKDGRLKLLEVTDDGKEIVRVA